MQFPYVDFALVQAGQLSLPVMGTSTDDQRPAAQGEEDEGQAFSFGLSFWSDLPLQQYLIWCFYLKD